MNEYNIIGTQEAVKKLLIVIRCKCTDRFPAEEGRSDINVKVEDEDVDEMIDFCEDYAIACVLVGV